MCKKTRANATSDRKAFGTAVKSRLADSRRHFIEKLSQIDVYSAFLMLRQSGVGSSVVKKVCPNGLEQQTFFFRGAT